MKQNFSSLVRILRLIQASFVLIIFLSIVVFSGIILELFFPAKVIDNEKISVPTKISKKVWQLPTMNGIMFEKNPDEIRYGRELISNTAHYLGPQGTVKAISNGMNCQNCHLDAGTRPWGNNYGAVLSTYPKFRERSGSIESIEKRVNDCFERSLNGQPLDTASREMKAIVSYIKYVGQFVKKDSVPHGTGIWKLKFLNRAADPQAGKVAYETKCVSCHGTDGQGIKQPDGRTYQYPPLWGAHAYNQGAGLYRLSRLAGYIKTNMPYGVTYENPQLTDEEAWDIAAYINSQPHPAKDLSKDWPKMSAKPVDHPFGPYADPFPEIQHKLGPFGPIDLYKKQHKK